MSVVVYAERHPTLYGKSTYIWVKLNIMPAPSEDKTRFDTRLSVEQKVLFEKAAAVGGYRNLTDFVIRTLQEKAEELMAERERIVASKRDSDIFFKAIIDPPKPNKYLTDAAKEYLGHRS